MATVWLAYDLRMTSVLCIWLACG